MRHLACSLLALLVVALGLAAATQLNESGGARGQIVVLTADPSGLLRDLRASTDVRVVQAWAGGHVLHLDGRGSERIGTTAVGVIVRLPASTLSLMACG